ncbi:hypothetical protein Q7P37_003111 [Cladosporium fusiforme]
MVVRADGTDESTCAPKPLGRLASAEWWQRHSRSVDQSVSPSVSLVFGRRLAATSHTRTRARLRSLAAGIILKVLPVLLCAIASILPVHLPPPHHIHQTLNNNHPKTYQPTATMPFTGSDIIKIICAVVLPPLGVFLERGCGADLLINILLTVLGYIPGIIHALYIILKY